MFQKLALRVIVLAAVLTSAVIHPALAAPPAYSGTYVVIDPYNSANVMFLKCAAETTPDADCYTLSASQNDFLNPFTGAEWTLGSATPVQGTQGANGILLRIPWCAFQTGAADGERRPSLGECHYQVWGPQLSAATTTPGVIYAGAYVGGVYQLNARGGTTQTQVDSAIGNLSTCGTSYDVGGTGGCSSSVLDTALGYLVTIAGNVPSASLKLSISLMAGKYTPISVLTLGGVSTIDLPQRQGNAMQALNYTICERLPLAWHTTSVGPSPPYAATPYETAYTNAQLALGQEIYRVSGLNNYVLKLRIQKESAITSNSLEFDVPARRGAIYTSADPQMSSPPQGAPFLQCPDMTAAVDGQTALRNAYTATGSSRVMTDAFEYTFGYIMGYEEGLASQSGPAAGALLSVPTKGLQAFAQVDCGQNEREVTCASDPSPNPALYNWEDYYFFEFLKHLDIPRSSATVAAAAGYLQACTGASCSPSSLTRILPTQMSIINTGLDASTSDDSGDTTTAGGYASEPQCWLNNAPAHPYILELYSTKASARPVSLLGDSVILGWQTIPGEGAGCSTNPATDQYYLQNGLSNGGQYLEIETDAAAETNCDADLSSSLTRLLSGNGNPQTTCVY